MNNVILTSKTYPGISFYSYTLGAGLSLRGEYPVAENLALYGELKGHINLVELLLSHVDFSSSFGTGLSLGTSWRY
jgi:hypothetical protein